MQQFRLRVRLTFLVLTCSLLLGCSTGDRRRDERLLHGAVSAPGTILAGGAYAVTTAATAGSSTEKIEYPVDVEQGPYGYPGKPGQTYTLSNMTVRRNEVITKRTGEVSLLRVHTGVLVDVQTPGNWVDAKPILRQASLVLSSGKVVTVHPKERDKRLSSGQKRFHVKFYHPENEEDYPFELRMPAAQGIIALPLAVRHDQGRVLKAHDTN